MRLKTILNQTEKYSSFVFEKTRFCNQNENTLIIQIRPRANSRPICSGCFMKSTIYDHQDVRRFDHIPLLGFNLKFEYKSRRVDCQSCGVTIEKLPWVDGKKEITKSYEWFLAAWAKDLSWKKVANKFDTGWDTVYRSVSMAVLWGWMHRDLSNVKAIGIDEIAKQKGHKYTTLVYQIDDSRKRLLWVGDTRTEETLNAFFDWFGKERTSNLEAICSDMWKPYINVIKDKAPKAIHVLDRFHIMSHMGKAIDEIRASEAKKMSQDGYEPVLKKSRFLLLERPENLSPPQEVKLAELVTYNLKSVRAYLLKEDFQNFWEYTSKSWAEKFLKVWCTRAMRSKLEPMKGVAKMLRRHHDLILNWFVMNGKLSSGIVEGFNTKAKLTIRKAFGFRSYKALRVALLHQLGDLPTPEFTHRYS